jgi:hypothetical protein
MTSDFLKKFLGPAEIQSAISEVATQAENEGAEVALIGGVALQLYGSDRMTKDIDFVGDREFEGLRDQAPLGIGGFKGKTSRGVQVDVLIGGDYPTLRQAALEEAPFIEELDVKVATLEHILALKLVAGRAKDELDMRTIFMLGGADLDRARSIISKHVGKYAVGDFNSLVDEVAWQMERDRKKGKE